MELALRGLSTETSLELVVEDLNSSIFYLDKITKKTTKEDILSSIFSSFCVGK
jgi:tRNA modification GTPase